MSISNMNRRQFVQSALCTGLIYGSGALPDIISSTCAAPLQNRLMGFLSLDGGPDFRHLIVPAYNASPDSFGNKYWSHRWRSHQLTSDSNTWQQRWNDDYYPITVGGDNWTGSLVNTTSNNNNVTFGIWREAGWLIDMFRAGNVALIFNAVGGTNRAHDLSTLMLNQGNVLSGLNDQDRSGWGGRLARSADGNMVSLNTSPSAFCFGPAGVAPNYNPNAIDNVDLLSVENAREMGLFDFDFEENTHQQYDRDDKMARAAKSYYAGLRVEAVAVTYQKFMDHEAKIREFGELIQNRLDEPGSEIPPLIESLYSGVNDINPAPGTSDARRVLSSGNFGRKIRNFYDMILTNDLVNPRVLSLSYGGWDSHGNQRQVPSILASDPNNPEAERGIENGLRDIFGGQFGIESSRSDPSALHGGLSALWQSLPLQADRDRIVLTIAGEFGRQIRDNGDAGTDHGKGNLMMVIGEQCAGGIYGEMFPEVEVDKYDDMSLNSPDIDPRTEIDYIFSKVCDWIQPNSGVNVFPRTDAGYGGEAPIIELPDMFSNLL